MRSGWIVLLVAVLPLGLAGASVAASTRIGYLDGHKVLVRSAAGMAIREQLEREQAAIQKDIDTRKVEIDKLRDELEKKGLVLSGDARREKEELLQRKVRDMRRLAEDSDKEIRRKEQQLRAKLGNELTTLVERYGKEKGYLIILERTGGAVLYGDPEADVTDEIIKLFDEQKAKEKK